MNDLQEAPASVTYSITSPNGFPALFTVRDMTWKDLLTKMTAIEAKFTEAGYKPQIKGFTPKEKVYTDYPCPICGAKVVRSTTKTGKVVEKCETQKFFNGQTSGCAYTKWV